MISTLEELQSYTEHRAAKSPVIADRVLLRSPGLSREERLRVARELPGIPDSYLDCAERFALETVELGMVALRPRAFGGLALVERLVIANGVANPVIGFLHERDLYEVASWETDPIAVVRTDAQHRPGQVVWVDITSESVFNVSPLASDFATLMVMAGRLWEAGHLGLGVEEALDGIELDAQQSESWRTLARMALG